MPSTWANTHVFKLKFLVGIVQHNNVSCIHCTTSVIHIWKMTEKAHPKAHFLFYEIIKFISTNIDTIYSQRFIKLDKNYKTELTITLDVQVFVNVICQCVK